MSASSKFDSILKQPKSEATHGNLAAISALGKTELTQKFTWYKLTLEIPYVMNVATLPDSTIALTPPVYPSELSGEDVPKISLETTPFSFDDLTYPLFDASNDTDMGKLRSELQTIKYVVFHSDAPPVEADELCFVPAAPSAPCVTSHQLCLKKIRLPKSKGVSCCRLRGVDGFENYSNWASHYSLRWSPSPDEWRLMVGHLFCFSVVSQGGSTAIFAFNLRVSSSWQVIAQLALLAAPKPIDVAILGVVARQAHQLGATHLRWWHLGAMTELNVACCDSTVSALGHSDLTKTLVTNPDKCLVFAP